MKNEGSIMAKRKYSIESRVDYSVILPVFFLLLIGLVAIYIATSNDSPTAVMKVMTQQVVWILLGCGIAFVFMLFSTLFLLKLTPSLYGLGLVLMVLSLYVIITAV